MLAIRPGRPEGLEFQRETRFPGRNGEPVDRPLPQHDETAPVVLAVYGPSAHVSEAQLLGGVPDQPTNTQANMIGMSAALRGLCKQPSTLRERALSTPHKPPRA
jgi:hypothetical protein